MMRRYVAEFIGVFLIVFFGCGAVATLAGGGSAAHLAVNLVFGLTVAGAVFSLGHISAAHFNPAVSVAFAIAGRFPWRYVLPYILAQLLGALAGAALQGALFPVLAGAVAYGSTMPGMDVLRAAGIEATITFFLMLVIISVATDRRVNGAVPGLAIGGTVALCGLFAGPLTGSSMNPARSLGPALIAGGEAMQALPLYLIAPVIGAAAAALLYEAIRGGDEHAQGAPNDLEIALEKISKSAEA